jgi:hypothetical protein
MLNKNDGDDTNISEAETQSQVFTGMHKNHRHWLAVHWQLILKLGGTGLRWVQASRRQQEAKAYAIPA